MKNFKDQFFFVFDLLILVQLLLVFVELSLLLGRGILVLLVFRHQVIHVGLCLGELHLIHTLAGVPMEESLPAEHSGKLLRDSLEQLLDGCGVSDEGCRHLQTTWRDVAYGGLDVVGDPFNEVAAVLVLDIQHLFVDLLHGHAATEDGGHCEVPAVARVAGGHHVLRVEHLLGEFGYCEGAVLLAATGGEWGEAGHEEVETGEGHHVDGQLSEIGVQLTREPEAGGHPRHGGGHQMVEVSVGWCGQFESTEADVVQGLVVDTVGLVCVLYQLMN